MSKQFLGFNGKDKFSSESIMVEETQTPSIQQAKLQKKKLRKRTHFTLKMINKLSFNAVGMIKKNLQEKMLALNYTSYCWYILH